jgi:hypothetical protein
MTDDLLLEKDWQTIQKVVDRFIKEQLRIEPNNNGLTTELKKVVTYLYAKVSNTGQSQVFAWGTKQPSQANRSYFGVQVLRR